MVNVDDRQVILAVHLSLLEMILQQSPKVFGPCGKYWLVTEVFVSTNEEDDIHKLLLYPGH